MFNSLIFSLFLVIINFTSLAQERVKLDPKFYRTWLRHEFYQDIMKGKTPRESMKMEPLMQLYFFPDTNLVLIGSFVEGMQWNFTITGTETITIYDLYDKGKIEFTIFLFEQDNEKRLVVDDGIEKMVFIGLDERYHNRNGVVPFINDRFITGDYVSADDSSLKVSFSSDGKVSGLKNYFEYGIPLFWIGLTEDFDMIILRYRLEGIRHFDGFHWKKSDDKLILFNIEPSDDDIDSEIRYRNAKILDKYVELIEINSSDLQMK